MSKLNVLKSEIGLAGTYAVQKMIDERGAETVLPADFLKVFDDVVEKAVAEMTFDDHLGLLLEGPDRERVSIAAGTSTLAEAVRAAFTRLIREMVQTTCDVLLLHFFEGRAATLVEKAYRIAAATPREFHMRDMGDAPERMEAVVLRFRSGDAPREGDLESLFELPAKLIEDSLQRQEDFEEMTRIVSLLAGLAALARSERAAKDLARQVAAEFAHARAA
ncbi:hypothetical protein [Rhizobium leguminosarum]|uniref:hypothetical protein n=1 Tax=Rhizobium leguminosarum TaxID=384 RepID=UPI002E1383A9|nr:hypothetical protein U8Q02_42840 [Rhizobium leguminosarum]